MPNHNSSRNSKTVPQTRLEEKQSPAPKSDRNAQVNAPEYQTKRETWTLGVAWDAFTPQVCSRLGTDLIKIQSVARTNGVDVRVFCASMNDSALGMLRALGVKESVTISEATYWRCYLSTSTKANSEMSERIPETAKKVEYVELQQSTNKDRVSMTQQNPGPFNDVDQFVDYEIVPERYDPDGPLHIPNPNQVMDPAIQWYLSN